MTASKRRRTKSGLLSVALEDPAQALFCLRQATAPRHEG